MGQPNQLNQIWVDRIRDTFRECFNRELNDEEIEKFLKIALENSERVYSTIRGYSEQRLAGYVGTQPVILFSPIGIMNEISRIAKEVGLERMERSSGGYKRLGEMTDAMKLVLTLKKIDGDEWMIKAQDSPDILLVRASKKRAWNDKPFDAISLEIMQIVEYSKKQMSADIGAEIGRFIEEKKFHKRYSGKPHLLVHLNFTHKGLILQDISNQLIKSSQDNPFYQIWLTFNSDLISRIMTVMVYPKLFKVEIDMLREQHLLF